MINNEDRNENSSVILLNFIKKRVCGEDGTRIKSHSVCARNGFKHQRIPQDYLTDIFQLIDIFIRRFGSLAPRRRRRTAERPRKARKSEREINIRHHMGKFVDKHNKCSAVDEFVFGSLEQRRKPHTTTTNFDRKNYSQ